MPPKSKRQNRRRRRRNNDAALAYMGPEHRQMRMRCPPQPPPFTSNLVIRKVFRFVAPPSLADPTTFTIYPAKLGGLISFATTTTNIVQLFESVKIHSISVWSSINNGTNVSISPREVAVIFPGQTAGFAGSNNMVSDESVGMTRVARVKVRPLSTSQAAQWMPTVTNLTPTVFQIVCGGGAVIDLDISATVTADTRSSNNNATITGPAGVGVIYYMALDNAYTGSGSVGNQLAPSGTLTTIT